MTNSYDETLKLLGVSSNADIHPHEVMIANDFAFETHRLIAAPGREIESLMEGITASRAAMAIGFLPERVSVVEGLISDATELYDGMGDLYARMRMPHFEPRSRDSDFEHNTLQSSNDGILILAANFKVCVSRTPIPKAVESVDPGAAFKPDHQALFVELEQSLRSFVEANLLALVGPNWVKRRVSQQVRERWHTRQAEERAAARPVFALIQYADFMDLAQILCQSDNWHEVFEPFFKNREDVSVSLQRLNPVRKAIAHSRPLGRVDALTLVSESARLFRAMGTRILN